MDEGRGLKGPRDTDLGRSISFGNARSGHYHNSAGFSQSRISVKECVIFAQYTNQVLP